MSRLVLVRHGETVWHAENRYAGTTDIALTPKGCDQAERLGRWAAGAQLSAVWSSPLSRARLTAAPAAQAANLPLQVEPRLTELFFGRGEGLNSAEMQARFPGERAAFEQDPVRNWLPGGENPMEAATRGAAALQALAHAQPAGARSLVVGHSTLFRLVLCRLLGVELSGYRTIFPQLYNGALTELDMLPDGVSLLSLNVPLPMHHPPEKAQEKD